MPVSQPPQDAPTDPDQLLRWGRVASVDLAEGLCTVELADDVETGPLPWIEARMGTTRVWSPPSVGEQVLLLCPAGELAGAAVLRGIASDDNPPAGDSLAQRILFPDGAELEYDPESHSLAVIMPAGGSISIVAEGGVAITGDVTLTGNLNLTGTVTAAQDVIADGKSLKSHKHGGVATGGAQTGVPV